MFSKQQRLTGEGRCGCRLSPLLTTNQDEKRMGKAGKYLREFTRTFDTAKQGKEEDFIELLHNRFSEADASIFYRFIGECFVLEKSDIAARIADNGLFLGALKPKAKKLTVFYQIHLGETVDVNNCFIPGFKWVKFGDQVYMPEPLEAKG